MYNVFSFYLGNARRAGSITLHVIALLMFNVFSIVGLEFTYGLSDFNIAAVGDWGCNSNTDKTVNNIVGKVQSLFSDWAITHINLPERAGLIKLIQ